MLVPKPPKPLLVNDVPVPKPPKPDGDVVVVAPKPLNRFVVVAGGAEPKLENVLKP